MPTHSEAAAPVQEPPPTTTATVDAEFTGHANILDGLRLAAHEHLARGWHPFPVDHPDQPLCIGLHGPKTPCDGQRGKHPAAKFGTWATVVTPQMIDLAWAARGGLANLGIACGPSALVVLDEDAPGELDRWAVTYGITLPPTYTVITPRGEHRYYQWDHAEQTIGNSAKSMHGFKIDVRGNGGYVLGAGSQHASGAIYTDNGAPLAPLPDKVADLLLAGDADHHDGDQSGFWEAGPAADPNADKIPDGRRHNALIAYAGRLRNKGLDYPEAEAAYHRRWLLCEQPLGQIPEARYHGAECRYPVTWEEARAKLADVYGRYPTGETDQGAAPGGPADPLEFYVEQRMFKMRAEREARRRLDDEERPSETPPPVKSLDALLAERDAPTRFRVDGLAPEGGRVMLSAQFKAGKSTLVGNLSRSLVDDERFLGMFAVNAPVGGLVLIDDELSENTLRRWLADQKIGNTAAVADVVALRGKVGAFNLLDDRRRSQWARRLSDVGCDYLILDCLRPMLDALGLDENRDAGKFLVAFDALLDEAGIPNALLVQHMGHANERARGDSRLQDWPDAIWRIVRETDDPTSARYFSAFGRDVDVPEGRLTFDPVTRRMTYVGESRTDAKAEAAYLAVIDLLADCDGDGGGMTGRAVEKVLTEGEHPQKAVRAALAIGVRRGVLSVTRGANRSKLHRIAHPCAECRRPVVTGGERHESCPAASGATTR